MFPIAVAGFICSFCQENQTIIYRTSILRERSARANALEQGWIEKMKCPTHEVLQKSQFLLRYELECAIGGKPRNPPTRDARRYTSYVWPNSIYITAEQTNGTMELNGSNNQPPSVTRWCRRTRRLRAPAAAPSRRGPASRTSVVSIKEWSE